MPARRGATREIDLDSTAYHGRQLSGAAVACTASRDLYVHGSVWEDVSLLGVCGRLSDMDEERQRAEGQQQDRVRPVAL